MPPEQNVRAEQILEQARSLSSVEEMEAFIRREVGDDETLLSEVTDILGKHLSDDETVPASEELLARLKINARADVQDDPLLSTKIGSCTLKRLIGSGGMGTVYEAMQESPRRRVAMKMMKRESFSVKQWESASTSGGTMMIQRPPKRCSTAWVMCLRNKENTTRR